MDGYHDSYPTRWNICRSPTPLSYIDMDWEPSDCGENFFAAEESNYFTPNQAEDIPAHWISRDQYYYNYNDQNSDFARPISYHDMIASGHRPIVNFGTTLLGALTEQPRPPRALTQDQSLCNHPEDSAVDKSTTNCVSTKIQNDTWYIAGSEVMVTSATTWSNVYGGHSSSGYQSRQDTSVHEHHQRQDITSSLDRGLGVPTSSESRHDSGDKRYGHSVYGPPCTLSPGLIPLAHYSNDDVTATQASSSNAVLSSIAKVSPEPSNDHHHHTAYVDKWRRRGLEVRQEESGLGGSDDRDGAPGSRQHLPHDRSVHATHAHSHSPECQPLTSALSSPMAEQTFTGTLELGIQKKNEKKPIMACLFCRERKIACGPPPMDSQDRTCKQCKRRRIKCEYPTESYRGQRRAGRKKKAALETNAEASA